jgi:hypothetical protein
MNFMSRNAVPLDAWRPRSGWLDFLDVRSDDLKLG